MCRAATSTEATRAGFTTLPISSDGVVVINMEVSKFSSSNSNGDSKEKIASKVVRFADELGQSLVSGTMLLNPWWKDALLPSKEDQNDQKQENDPFDDYYHGNGRPVPVQKHQHHAHHQHDDVKPSAAELEEFVKDLAGGVRVTMYSPAAHMFMPAKRRQGTLSSNNGGRSLEWSDNKHPCVHTTVKSCCLVSASIKLKHDRSSSAFQIEYWDKRTGKVQSTIFETEGVEFCANFCMCLRELIKSLSMVAETPESIQWRKLSCRSIQQPSEKEKHFYNHFGSMHLVS